MLYNHRLLSIAVRDAELRAPVQIGQTYDINSQDRPVIDTTNKAAVLPVLPLPLPLPTARPGRQSFVGGPHPLGRRGRQHQPEASMRAMLSTPVAFVLFAASCWQDRLSLSQHSENHQRTIGTKSWIILHLRTESRKVTLKCRNIWPKNGRLADISDCKQRFHRLGCETLKDWHNTQI